MNTPNSQRNITTNATPDISKLTYEYILPDFSGDPDSIQLPNKSELLFLGKSNLIAIRRMVRRVEKDIKEKLEQLKTERNAMTNATPQDLQNYSLNSPQDAVTKMKAQLGDKDAEKAYQEKISRPYDGSNKVMCNWHGGALSYLQTVDNLSAEEWKELTEQKAKLAGTCGFGRFVAQWCQMAPCSEKCGIMCPACAKKIRKENGEIVIEQCKHHEICIMADQPFSDQECILTQGDEKTLQSCRDYLRKQVGVWKRRKSLAARYIDKLTRAIELAENKPVFAIFRKEIASGAKPTISGQHGETTWMPMSSVVVLMGSPHVYTGFDNAMRDKTKAIMHLAKKDAGENLYPILTVFRSDMSRTIDPFAIEQEVELPYLREHDDYCDLWARLSCSTYIEYDVAVSEWQKAFEMTCEMLDTAERARQAVQRVVDKSITVRQILETFPQDKQDN